MKKLYREKNSILGGVCSGIGDYFNIDAIFVRLLFILLFFTSFPSLILYLIMWFLIPKKKTN